MEKEVYRCESCDGIMEYDIDSKMLKCPNCGNTVAIINETASIIEHPLTIDAKRTLQPSVKHSSTMECTGCGATLEIAKDDTTSECPYCGSTYVLSQKQLDAIIPDGIIPFAIDQNNAKELFRNWVSKRWLAPHKLKTMYQQGEMKRLYLPYWTFDAESDASYTAMGGRHRTERYRDKDGNTRTKSVTDWYHTSGHIHHNFDDVLVKAVSNERSIFLEKIEPYDLGRIVSYAPQYLQGCVSQCYDVNLSSAHQSAREIMASALHSDAGNDVRRRYDTVKNIHIQPVYRNETYKHIFVPVYATSYHYEHKLYQVAINGQTGNVHGDYPKSPIKIAAIVIAAILLIIAILYNFYIDDYGNSYEGSISSAIELCDSEQIVET